MKTLVMLSGGLDSSTSLARAISLGDSCEALFIDYGQRSLVEYESAELIAGYYKVRLVPVECRGMLLKSSLIKSDSNQLKEFSADDEFSAEGDAYVPGRNLMLVGIGLSYAESRKMDRVVLGIMGVDEEDEDDPILKDQHPKFLQAVDKAAAFAKDSVKVDSLLLDLTWRRQVITLAAELEVPLGYTYSCYSGKTEHCGTCEACVIRILSFKRAGYKDPVAYSEEVVNWEDCKEWPIEVQ